MLASANQLGADYLFQKDKLYDVQYDTGDKAIQCGRHNDIFKLWLMWRSKGDNGFERQIDNNFSLAKYVHLTRFVPQSRTESNSTKLISIDYNAFSSLQESILMSNENAPLFRCAWLWLIKSCAKLCYL